VLFDDQLRSYLPHARATSYEFTQRRDTALIQLSSTPESAPQNSLGSPLELVELAGVTASIWERLTVTADAPPGSSRGKAMMDSE
jgi:hypothetical protein